MATTQQPVLPAQLKAQSDDAAPAKKVKVAGSVKVKGKELADFTNEMSALLSAGLPITEALHSLEKETPSKAFQQVLGGIRAAIETGSTLTKAMSRYPGVFDGMYLGIIKTGEMSGNLPESMERLAEYLDSQDDVRRKVKSVMFYPIVIALIAGALTTGMLVWIVPAFEKIYEDLGGTLPAATQFLITISNALRHHGIFVLVGLVAVVILLGRLKRTEAGAALWDRLSLRVPVFGPLLHKLAISRLAACLAQLTRNGIPILSALNVVSDAVGNKAIAKAVQESRSVVERGDTLSSALRKHPDAFPRTLIKMVAAGEKSGRLDDMLERMAKYYEKEVRAMVAGLSSMIEPLMISFIGLVVGGIVLCMFLPIFKMHELVNF